MNIRLELNGKFGRGYQLRLQHGPVDKVYDAEPLTLYEAGSYAQFLLESANKALGTAWELHEVLVVTEEGLRGNQRADLASARLLRDAESGSPKLTIAEPREKPDFIPMTQEEAAEHGDEDGAYWVSGRGTVILGFLAWKQDNLSRAQEFMERYCELAAARGGPGAKKIMRNLRRMSVADGVEWIKQTYPQYVRSDREPIEIMSGLAARK